MKKPESLKIKELLDKGHYSEAHAIAVAAANQYPAIKIYKDLLHQCEARFPSKIIIKENKSTNIANSGQSKIDLETFEYHLKKQLDKVRAKEVSPVQAWDNISFLAPDHWPRDSRLTRIMAPSVKALKTHFNQDNLGTLILTGDIRGGAGIAALRVFECLNAIGHKTDILYRDDNKVLLRRADQRMSEVETDDITQTFYSGIEYGLIEELREHINNEVHHNMALKALGSNTFLFHTEDSFDIGAILQFYSSINIHWGDFLLTAAGLESLAKSPIPITITLHDMYWLNGSCHYSAGCNQFVHGCTACPLITGNSDPIIHYNSYHSHILRSLKDLVVISPSEWLCELAAKSHALMGREIYYIPNPQTTKAKKKIESPRIQRKDSVITLVYGALGLEEKRKGYAIFIELNKELLRRQVGIRFKVFGRLTPEQEQELQQYSCEVLGFLSHTELAAHFIDSHAMLLLSHEDNYPNLCVEAASAGLPIIASNNSGLKSLIESSGGGVLTPNDPIEIANIIEKLSIDDVCRLGDNITQWHTHMYSDSKLERACEAVISRSDGRKEFLYENEDPGLINDSEDSKEAILKCEYIKKVSEFAVEVLVPYGEYDNKFTMSYSLKHSSTPLDVYIDGYSHEAHTRLNSDGLTYTIEGLPAGKCIKLIKHDTTSKYYYKKLELSNISIYPSSLRLGLDRSINSPSGVTICGLNSGFMLCDDSLTIEYHAGESLYWLLAHKRYSLHFLCLPAVESSTSVHGDASFLISFLGIDLRHDPLQSARLEINTSGEVITLEPFICDHSFGFLLEASLLDQMNSAFLVTTAGEVLEDGREVVGLIKQHTIAVQ